MAIIGLKELRPGFFEKENQKCYSCIFRKSVPGSAHSSCSKKRAYIEAEPHGVRSGWVIYPFDFDPVWITGCDSFFKKGEYVNLTDRKELELQIDYQITYLIFKMERLRSYDFVDEVDKVLLHKPREECSMEELNKLLFDLLQV